MEDVDEVEVVGVEVDVEVVVVTAEPEPAEDEDAVDKDVADEELVDEELFDEELADEEAVGVVKVEISPLLLTGYYQHTLNSGWTCKRTSVQEGIAEGLVEKANI